MLDQDDVITKAPPLSYAKEADHNGGSSSPENGSNKTLLETAGQVALDPALEKRLRRKFDRTLVVLVFLAYMLAFLDRSNIGNAELAGMSNDLGFDDAHFQVRC